MKSKVSSVRPEKFIRSQNAVGEIVTLKKTIDEMRSIAEELAQREGLTGQIYILNTTGCTRDDFNIGYEYPADKAMEERLNRTFSALRIKDWANGLPPEQREEYLREIRGKGYEGYL